MENIEQHIANLLHSYDCVILPNFGGFITNTKEGYMDALTNVFHPSYKQILFNKNLVNNDGLLANEIVDKENISYQQANILLQEYKDSCYARLNENGRIEIERIGVLFFDQEKNIQFQQSSKNFLIQSFGLTPKYIRPLPIEKEEVVNKTITKVTAPIEKPAVEPINRKPVKPVKQVKKRKRSVKKVLLPMLIVPIIAGGVFVASHFSSIRPTIALASINPFYSTTDIKYIPRSVPVTVSPEEEKVTIVLVDTIPSIEETKITERVEEQTPKKEVEIKTISSLPYHVIGGCFNSQENADTFVSEWKQKGKDAQIIGRVEDMYRVSIQSFSNRADAANFKKEIKESYNLDSWVLKQ